MTTQTQRKSGKSYNRLSNQWYLKPANNKEPIYSIMGIEVSSAAQGMTAIAYDEDKIPVRSLDYRVKCNDFKDWTKCILLIGSYNEFDASRIIKHSHWKLNLMHFLNEDNGNNGMSLFTFHIGRESSPVFYITYNSKWDTKIITDIEEIPASEGKEAITEIYWEEYTIEDFKANMQELSSLIGADEFSIEERFGFVYEARFWFD